jgi:hypothetical protein
VAACFVAVPTGSAALSTRALDNPVDNSFKTATSSSITAAKAELVNI